MKWIKDLFCKHDYQPFVKVLKFQNLRGERVYYICTKCGHGKGSVFHEHL